MMSLSNARGTPTRIYRVFGLLLAILVLSLSMTIIVSAQGGANATTGAESVITRGVTTGFQKVYNIMTAILTPAAVVCFAWAAFQALFFGERGMESAKKTMLIIILIVAIVLLAPTIIKEIAGWFDGLNTGNDVFAAASGGTGTGPAAGAAGAGAGAAGPTT